jgi:hypothetical protein
MRTNEHDATQTERRESDRLESRHGEPAIQSSGLGSFGMRAKYVPMGVYGKGG